MTSVSDRNTRSPKSKIAEAVIKKTEKFLIELVALDEKE
jgi:hypothetical protein